jgi:hypothetical protein
MSREAPTQRTPWQLFQNSAGRLCTLENGELVLVERDRLHALLARYAEWLKEVRFVEKPAPVPARILGPMLADVPHLIPRVQELRTVPTYVGEDWTLRTEPGYDLSHETMYAGDELFPAASGDAVGFLFDEWLTDFPFARPCDRAACMALLLTLFARGMLDGLIPAFVIESAEIGSGKTLLGMVLCVAATGVVPAVGVMPRTGDEMRKKLFSAAIAGRPILFLDNVSSVRGEVAEALAAVLTGGLPKFATYDTVMLYVSRYEGELFHQKYQFHDVYLTADGRWAGCGDPHRRGPEVHRGDLEPRAIDFVPIDVSGMNREIVDALYPPEDFTHGGRYLTCKAGNYAEELFEVKKGHVLKAREIFD